ATAADTQTIAATPSTAATPPVSAVTPRATKITAVRTRAVRVSPEIGLLLEPIIPTRYPETAAKKKAKIISKVAETIATKTDVLKIKKVIEKVAIATIAMPTIIQLNGMSLSILSVDTEPPVAAFLTSETERAIPAE